jgi:hypothetical protein
MLDKYCLLFLGAKVRIIFDINKKKWKKISFNPIFFHFLYKNLIISLLYIRFPLIYGASSS